MGARRRTFRVGVGVIVAVVVPAVGDAAPAPPFDTVPDGSWVGKLVYDVEASFPGEVHAEVAATGGFDFVVAGGIVTEGTMDYSANGLGTAAASGAAGVLDFTGHGGVEGNASTPALRVDGGNMSGVIHSGGVEVPVDMSFGAGALPPIPLEIFAVTCEQVSGDFVQPTAAAVSGAGGTGSFSGHWLAVRADDPASAGTVGAYEQLVIDTQAIVNGVNAGGPLDHVALLETLDRAEQLAATVPINAECRNIQPEFADAFSSMISLLIYDLIEAVIASPDAFNLTALQLVVQAGLRTGLLAPNPSAGSKAAVLSPALQALFDARLTTALGPPVNVEDVNRILLTATMMGWTSTADTALQAL